MTIRHLKIFIAVVETGKMSAAAKMLYIAQPSVSQSIRELEEHYQTLLFHRYAKKLYITDSGKQLYTYAKQAILQFDLVEEYMLSNKPGGKMRIGATISVGGSILSPMIRDFKKENPDMDVYAFVGNTREIEAKILDMDLDLAIVEGHIKSPDITVVPVLPDPLVLALSKDHPLGQKEHLTIEDLQDQEFVIREKGSGTRELLETFAQKHHLSIRIAFEEHTPDAIKKALEINGCLTLISPRLIEKELSQGELVAYQSKRQEWNRYFHIVYHNAKGTENYIPIIQNMLTKYEKEYPVITRTFSS